MRFFRKTNIDFMGKRHLWYTVSGIVILVGMISFFVKGPHYGIDFLGGTEIVVTFQDAVPISTVRAAMDKIGIGKTAEIMTFGSDKDILIRTSTQGEGSSIGDLIRGGLKQEFPSNPFVVQKEDKIGPKIGAELRLNAIYAVFALLIAIMVYIGFRFKFVYGIGAVASLFHDVLVTLGLVSLFDGVLNLELSQNMVAAFLTLVGLSVNDTVVIFDRIRENQKIFRNMDLITVINKSLNETLSRTIITSGTVFTVLLVLFFFGGEVNRGFSFTLLIGITTGTYSSIYIASAIVVEWALRINRKAAQHK
ncbi:MAG TPA: protein translocase subunit SecF [Bacteroidota bacterium]|nr:protein translocase subunit SecF [Bacteroidota bacterium]